MLQILGLACLTRRLPFPLKADVEIAYTNYVLDNGLTLLVLEDRTAPIVSAKFWYNVGSKN